MYDSPGLMELLARTRREETERRAAEALRGTDR